MHFVRRQLNITGAAFVKQTSNDFNRMTENDRDESRMASGRLFQVRGPAMANDLSPSLRHVELPTATVS